MQILVSGATEFLGTALCHRLVADGHQVTAWVRSVVKARRKLPPQVVAVEVLPSHESTSWDAVINLAGEPIVGKRWTAERKLELRESRIGLTRQLVKWMAEAPGTIPTLLSGSAIGFYGSQPANVILSESSSGVESFPHQLCRDWEEAALHAQDRGARVCLLRTGIVLDANQGALSKMLPPFRLGAGGPIGSGTQMMSWIHRQDWIEAVCFLLNHPTLSGVFNLVAPNPVSNLTFSKQLASVLHRPCWLPVPGVVIGLLMGESAELVTEGQCVIPKRLSEAGYAFHHPQLQGALSDLFP